MCAADVQRHTHTHKNRNARERCTLINSSSARRRFCSRKAAASRKSCRASIAHVPRAASPFAAAQGTKNTPSSNATMRSSSSSSSSSSSPRFFERDIGLGNCFNDESEASGLLSFSFSPPSSVTSLVASG